MPALLGRASSGYIGDSDFEYSPETPTPTTPTPTPATPTPTSPTPTAPTPVPTETWVVQADNVNVWTTQ